MIIGGLPLALRQAAVEASQAVILLQADFCMFWGALTGMLG